MLETKPLLALVATVLMTRGLCAQRIIYDGTRDKTAQDAATAAKDIARGSLFDTMLRNVDAQAKLEASTAFLYSRQQMRASLEAFTYWKSAYDKPATVGKTFIRGTCLSVECELKGQKLHIEFDLKPLSQTEAEITARLADLAEKKDELEKAIKELKDASKDADPLVIQAFSLIENNGKEVLDYAGKIANLKTKGGAPLTGVSNALDDLGKGMDEMLGLYNAVKGIFAGYQAVAVDPASLRPPQAQTDLQLLALEQDHLKTILLIRARAKIESAVTLGHIEGVLKGIAGDPSLVNDLKVETSLAEAVKARDRDRLLGLLDILYEAEAALAEEDVPAKLAAIRVTDEARRYSIRRSAVNSSTYDLTINAASQRLALYWKSGIKPTDVAALLFYVTNTVAIPVIAAK
jgi:hypothetical protein